MDWLVENMTWIMVVSGLFTMTMLFAVIAPTTAMRVMFGETFDTPAGTMLIRNRAVLVALIGAMLVYGAIHPPVRPLVLTVAMISKTSFILLVLSHGTRFVKGAGVAVIVDTIIVILFGVYLAVTAGAR